MKRSATKLITAIVIAVLFPVFLFAQQVAEKKFTKSWNTNTQSTVEIINKFGDIQLIPWTKNEVQIDVLIKIEHSNADKAKELLEYVNIKTSEEGSKIIVETTFDEQINKFMTKQTDGHRVKILYTIHHPIYLMFDIKNKYGDLTIDELTGKSNFDIKFGDIKAKNLNFDDTKPFGQLDLSYGKAEIEKCSWMQFNIKYSDLTVNEATALIIISSYSNLASGVIHSIVANSEYDNYKIKMIKNLVIDAKYSDISCDFLEKQIVSNISYTDLKIHNIQGDFEKIKVDTKYGDVKLGISPSACYTINASCEFGEIKVPEKANINRHVGNYNVNISGTVGCKESKSSTVEITGKYADIKLEN